MAAATSASSTWTVDVKPLGLYIAYPPHNFKHEPPRVVFHERGAHATYEANRLRTKDFAHWINVTGYSEVQDWFSPTLIECWSARHCKAILMMIAIMNLNDVSEYANMIEFLFRSYPQELHEIALSRVEDVFSPEEINALNKRFLQIVLWMIRDQNKTIEQHEEDEIELEAARVASSYAAIPRNMAFSPLLNMAYQEAVGVYGYSPAAGLAVHNHIKNYLQTHIWNTFNGYVRSIHWINFDSLDWSAYVPQVRSFSAPGYVVNAVEAGDSSATTAHQRAVSLPVPTTAPMDGSHDNIDGAEQEMASTSPITHSETANTTIAATPGPGSSSTAATAFPPISDADDMNIAATAASMSVPVPESGAVDTVTAATPMPDSSPADDSVPAPVTDAEVVMTAPLLITTSSTAAPIPAPEFDVGVANDHMATAIVSGPSAMATTMEATSVPWSTYYTTTTAHDSSYLGASMMPAQPSAFVQAMPREHTRGPSNRVASNPAFVHGSGYSPYASQPYTPHQPGSPNATDWRRGGPTNDMAGGMSGSPGQIGYHPVAVAPAFSGAGPSSMEMGYPSTVPQYQSFENQTFVPYLQQGSYAQGMVPATYPSQATNMGTYYAPIAAPSEMQPFPAFQQDFVDPYAGGQMHHTTYNTYGGPRPKGNSFSRGRGRGRRASQQNESSSTGPAIYNPETNRLEAVDSFGRPVVAQMGPQSRPRDGFNQNRSGQRERNISFSQFRGNGHNGRSNYNGRRSSASRHQGPHYAPYYGQQAMGSQRPLDLPGPSTSSRPLTPAGPSNQTAPTHSGKGKAKAVDYLFDVNEPPTSSAAPTCSSKYKSKTFDKSSYANEPSSSSVATAYADNDNSVVQEASSQPSASTALTYSGKDNAKVLGKSGPSNVQASAPAAAAHVSKGTANVASQEDGGEQDSQNLSAPKTTSHKTERLTKTRAAKRREKGKGMTDSTSGDDGAVEGSGSGTNIDDVGKMAAKAEKEKLAAQQAATSSELLPDIDGTIRRSSESQLYGIQPESINSPSPFAEPSVQDARTIPKNTEMLMNKSDQTKTKAGGTENDQTVEAKSQENSDSDLGIVKKNKSGAETDKKPTKMKNGENAGRIQDTGKENALEVKESGQQEAENEEVKDSGENMAAEANESGQEPVKHKYTLADWKAAPAQIQQREAQELALAQAFREAARLKPSQMAMPPMMEVFKKTAIEGSYGPRRVLSTTETSRGSDPVKTPPSEAEIGKTEEKAAGPTPDAENSFAETSKTGLSGVALETNAASAVEPPQGNGSWADEEEVFVTPQQEPSSSVTGVETSEVTDISSPTPTTSKGKDKCKADQSATQSKLPGGSTDAWVHPMARASRQAKLNQEQAKKERKKEKKQKQAAKKSGLANGNSLANTEASGLIAESSNSAAPEQNVEELSEEHVAPVAEPDAAKTTSNASKQSLSAEAEEQTEPAAPEAAVATAEATEPAPKKKSKSKKKKKKRTQSSGDGEGEGDEKGAETEAVAESSKATDNTTSPATTTKPKENIKPALPIKPPTGKNIQERIKSVAASVGLSENKSASNRPS